MSDQDAKAPLPKRMLIDGKLVEAERTYPTVNPATGQVFAHAPDASVADAEAAVAAARRAFDTTSWPTDVALRARCLDQLHKALTEHKEELRELTITDVGAPRQITYGAQLDQPIEIVRFYADLLPGYPLTEEIGQIEFMGKQHRRWVEKEAAGVVAAIIGYNYPTQLALAKLAPALAAGCTVVLKAAPDTPLITLALAELIANHTDIPPGRRQHHLLVLGRGRGGAHHQPRRGPGDVHRRDRDRPGDHGGRGRHHQAGLPRARRQVRPGRAGRRRPRRARHGGRVRDLLARRPGVRDPDPDGGAPGAPRRGRRPGRGHARRGHVRRPGRPRQLHGPADQRTAAGQGRRPGPAGDRGRRHPRHRRHQGRPRATSTPRRCWPTSTRTARSPRKRRSARCW